METSMVSRMVEFMPNHMEHMEVETVQVVQDQIIRMRNPTLVGVVEDK